MSMTTSPSSSSVPPTPAREQRLLAEWRAASTREARRARLVNRVGFCGAVLTAALALGWVVAVTLSSVFNVPPGQWGLVTQFAPSLFLALAYVVLMAAIRDHTPAEHRIWANIAVQMATIYAALNATVYFVEVTLVTPRKLSGDLGTLGFLDMQSGLFLFAVDVFGYTMMSLAAAFAALAFAGPQSRLEQWIFWLLLANWPFAVVGPLVMMFTSQGVSLMVLWAVIWTLIIPVPAILLAVRFWRGGWRVA